MEKKCPNCGALVSDDDAFCITCGTNLKESITVEQSDDNSEYNENNWDNETEKNYNKKRKIIGITSAVALLLVAVIISIVVFRKPGTEHTITFDSMGGSECASIVTKGKEVLSLPIPQRSGYIFEGWYTQKNAKGSQLFSTDYQSSLLTSDQHYYANWMYYKNTSASKSSNLWRLDVSSNPDYYNNKSVITIKITSLIYEIHNGMTTRQYPALDNINVTIYTYGKSVHFYSTTTMTVTVNQVVDPWDTISYSVSGSYGVLTNEIV